MKMNLYILFILISSVTFAAENDVELVYRKSDKQTPADINDDHMVIRQISSEEEATSLAVSGGNIYFEIDKAVINNTENIKIEEMAKAIKQIQHKINYILLEGFASVDGDSNRNLNLGKERAEAVKTALEKEGVKSEILKIKTFGDKKQFQFENKNKNRRTQIRIFLKKR